MPIISPDEYYKSRYHTSPTRVGHTGGPCVGARLRILSACVEPNDRVLDYGCGNGVIIGNIARSIAIGPASCGVDISAVAVEQARELFPNVKFYEMQRDAPLDDETYDVILSAEVLEHVFDTGGIIAEWFRLLRPGGTLAITVPYYGWIKDLLIVLSRRHENHFHQVHDPHIRSFTKNTLRKVLTQGRFEVNEIVGFGSDSRPLTSLPFCWVSMFARSAKPG